jgi:putative ABC transport system substrate-binding protein
MSTRREFLLGAGALLGARLARAQSDAKIHRVGYLSFNAATPASSPLLRALLAGLDDLGYVESRNLAFETRHADGKPERLPAAAAALILSKPDVIVTAVNAQTHAARKATPHIPIVMVVGTDVIGEGLAQSLARPGGNVTGLTWDVGADVMAKRFEFLKEAVPNLSRVAVLWDPGQDAAIFESAIARGAAATGLKLNWLNLKENDDLEQHFATAARERDQAVFTGGGARLWGRRKQVVALAAKYRLPDTHYSAEFVEAGGLMAYAPNLPAMFKRAAVYVDKILRGAKPGDLPIEQPTEIDLLVNLKTAKALGLNIPQSLLLRADRVIE